MLGTPLGYRREENAFAHLDSSTPPEMKVFIHIKHLPWSMTWKKKYSTNVNNNLIIGIICNNLLHNYYYPESPP